MNTKHASRSHIGQTKTPAVDRFQRNQKPPLPRAPSHFACNVRNREGGDNYRIRIGGAWANADGNGFNIQLETVPLDGRIALRVATEKNK